jgi:tetratricopeptide (TPR) repeat protein
MTVRMLLVCILVGCGAVGAACGEEDPQTVFVRGRTLLEKGEFQGALQAFVEAARMAPDNEAYRQQAFLVRRVIQTRDRLAEMTDTEQWTQTAITLHTFYHDNRIYTKALELDRQIHERLANTRSATMLAQTLIALNLDSDAVQLLGSLAETQRTPEIKALLGIALARQGKIDQAKALIEGLEIAETTAPELLFDCARLRALLGDQRAAIGLLVRCFQSTAPSRLPRVKDAARESPDLAALAEGDAFAAALTTESRVKESGCSSGSSCGKCPHRAKCGSAGGKADEGQKAEKP